MSRRVVIAHDLPDAGEGMCCYGAALGGPGRCTCWRPVYDREQVEDLQLGPASVRSSMCEDCAFRKDSPERQGDARYENAGEDLAALDIFFCHQCMRRKVELVHPSGARVAIETGAYEPPVRGALAWKADGTPAEVCAGIARAKGWRR